MMTEAEARTKWCPFAFPKPFALAVVGCNRNTGRYEDSPKCVASECMAWRTESNYLKPTSAPVNGFCGLAGRE